MAASNFSKHGGRGSSQWIGCNGVDAADTSVLDRTLAKVGCRVLQGRRVKKVTRPALPAMSPCGKMLRAVPSSLALAMERLCWWQKIAQRPQA